MKTRGLSLSQRAISTTMSGSILARFINFIFANSSDLELFIRERTPSRFISPSVYNQHLYRMRQRYGRFEFDDWLPQVFVFLERATMIVNLSNLDRSTLVALAEYKDKNTKLSIICSLDPGRLYKRGALHLNHRRAMSRALRRLTDLQLITRQKRGEIRLTSKGSLLRKLVLQINDLFEQHKPALIQVSRRNR